MAPTSSLYRRLAPARFSVLSSDGVLPMTRKGGAGESLTQPEILNPVSRILRWLILAHLPMSTSTRRADRGIPLPRPKSSAGRTVRSKSSKATMRPWTNVASNDTENEADGRPFVRPLTRIRRFLISTESISLTIEPSPSGSILFKTILTSLSMRRRTSIESLTSLRVNITSPCKSIGFRSGLWMGNFPISRLGGPEIIRLNTQGTLKHAPISSTVAPPEDEI
mmetsp:Transcript_58481/g.132432  ORF Transcript_58481/g.132432 Transcript_58481/m.132432 type:complete len:223 (+) Transcript_58481:131-799(+)